MDRNSQYYFIPLKEPIPLTEQHWPEDVLPLVHTRTMTYMHEDFIKDCIEGLLMQKTTFPVQILIHDDSSTDKTAEIVREYEQKYPCLIKAFYQKENSFTKPDKHERRTEFMNWRIGKYEAICEGDDYWIDPLKLQKQVDFMESHPEYGVTSTSLYILNNKTRKIKPLPLTDTEYKFEDFILGNRISNLTSCIRMDLLKLYYNDIKPENKGWKSGDYPMWLYLSKISKIKCLPFRSAVYRELEESASHSKDNEKLLHFSNYHHSLRKFYIDYFHVSNELLQKVNLYSYRESSTLAIITNNSHFYNEILNFYVSNGYTGLARFLLIKKKFPGIIHFLVFIEKVMVKVGVINFGG